MLLKFSANIGIEYGEAKIDHALQDGTLGLLVTGNEGAARIELETWLAGPERTLDAIDPPLVELVRAMLLRSYALDVDAPRVPLQPPACDRLAEIDVPTLVISGARDARGMHAIAERILQGVEQSRGAVFADSAHMPNLEQPAAFDRSLREFLA